MSARVRVCLIVWGIVSSSLSFAGEDAVGDEQLLRAAGIATDDRSLLDFFRRQTLDETLSRRAHALIDQLGSDSFPMREQASDGVAALGPVILPLLRQTIRATPDLEVRRRARDCVAQIESRWLPALAASAARLLARRKPPGTAETLLAFLPGPYDDRVHDEIQAALVVAARLNGELNPAVLRALTARTPERRTAAAVALCRCGAGEQVPAVRKLLHDPEASVRLCVAQELASGGERQAVPVLIDLLAQLPAEQAEQAEECLYRLAGSTAPPVVLGKDARAQQRCRDGWRDWWRAYGASVEMAVLKNHERQLGYTLLVLLNDNRVVEWDRDGRPRWQITGLAAPLDAEILPGRRVLIAEYDAKRVTERTFKGEMVWEKKLSEPPIHAQRLPDGGVCIATRKQVLEVDRSGNREVVRYRSDNDGITTVQRYRDGRLAYIEKGSYVELNAAGQELRRFAAPPGVCTTNALTLLPNGHLLIASYGGGFVQEYDRAGKVVWEIKMGRPLCALRLPGGHTLVSTQDMVLIEFDRSGNVLARHPAAGHPCQIRRR
jgi:HEAT repeat protein